MLLHYLKITFRNILNNKFRYLLTTLGIAVGVAIFASLYFMIDIATHYMGSLPDDKNVYVLETILDTKTNLTAEGADLQSWRNAPIDGLTKLKEQNIPEFDAITTFSGTIAQHYCCPENNERLMYSATIRYVDADFFSVVGAKITHGNVSTWDNRRLAVITEDFAKKLFGSASKALGQNIDVRATNNYMYGVFTVSAIIKPIYAREYSASIYLENESAPYKDYYLSLVKLKENSSIAQVNNKLKTISKDFGMTPFIQNEQVSGMYFGLESIQNNKVKIPIFIQVVIALLASTVLIIALFNFFNLLLSSVQARIRQFTLRRIVGANRKTFLLMLFCEIVPILAGALLISYVFIELLLQWYRSAAFIPVEMREINDYLHLIYGYPLRVMAFTLLACLVVAVLLTFRIQKIVLIQGVRGKLLKSNRNIVRNGLIFVQLLFTLLFFSISAELFRIASGEVQNVYETLSREQAKAVFQMTFRGTLGMSEKEAEVISRIKQISGVESVALTQSFQTHPRNIKLSNGKRIEITTNTIFDGYQKFMELKTPLPFTTLAPDEMIVNEALAKELAQNGETDIEFRSMKYKIVATVPQIPYTSDKQFAALLPLNNSPEQVYYIKCLPSQARKVEKHIMQIVREYVPESIPYQLPTLYESVTLQNSMLHIVLGALSIATLMSFIITLFGIYSAVSADTARRRKEIAIRKINGATYRDILWKYLKQYVIMLCVILLFLFPFHIFVIQTMNIDAQGGNLFKISTILLTWSVLALFVFFTIYNLIKKAASENPAEVVKWE